MKKTFLTAFIFAGFIFYSCRKSVTCECTSSNTTNYKNTSSSGVTSGYTRTELPVTTTKVYKKIKKSNLETVCGDITTTSEKTNISQTDPSAASSTAITTHEIKCNIK